MVGLSEPRERFRDQFQETEIAWLVAVVPR